MEVYATQPGPEVLKCQQHVVVVPNLRLHSQHTTTPRLHQQSRHLQLPKLQIGPQSISAPASPACAAATIAQPPKFNTSTTTTSSAPSVEMKRSYEQTKTKKEPSTAATTSSRSTKNKCSVKTNGSTSSPSTTSLPLISPCHKDKMAAAAAAASAATGSSQTSKMGLVQTSVAVTPPVLKAKGATTAEQNNNNNVAPAPTLNANSTLPTCETGESEPVKNRCDSPCADVFLGGSCNPTTWRTDQAIPLLKKLGISYYNPQVANWCPDLISLEHEAKTHAKCLLFVIDSQTRSVVGLIEVAFLAAQGRRVVLVLPNHERSPGQAIMGEAISHSEFQELSSAHALLKKLVERHQIPVFNDLDEAIHCIARILKNESDEERPQSVSENNLREVYETLSSKEENNTGEINYSQIPRAYQLLTKTSRQLASDQIRTVIDRLTQYKNRLAIQRSQSSTSSSSSSSGDDSPPLKKDLVGEERFNATSLASSKRMTNGGGHDSHEEHTSTRTGMNFEEFKFLMTELLGLSNQNSFKSEPLQIQHALAILERLLDEIDNQAPAASHPLPNQLRSHDVFLGGPTASDWKKEKVIPFLEKHNMTYCSTDSITATSATANINVLPSTSKTYPGLADCADDCRLLFVYLNGSSRAVELMTLASYYIGLDHHRLVFCIEELQDDCQSGDEKLTKIAIKDYNRGRAYISDIASRNSFPVHQNLDEALQKVVDLCQSS